MWTQCDLALNLERNHGKVYRLSLSWHLTFYQTEQLSKKEGRKNIIEPESPFLQAFLPFSSLSETESIIEAAFF